MLKNIFRNTLVAIFLMMSLAVVMPANVLLAQNNQPTPGECSGFNPEDPYGLKCGEQAGLSKQDPRSLVGRVIAILVSILGIVLICFVVYAGALWMTSAGDDEKITKAKSIISSSIIGLIIVLAAYSISTFIVNNISRATGQ